MNIYFEAEIPVECSCHATGVALFSSKMLTLRSFAKLSRARLSSPQFSTKAFRLRRTFCARLRQQDIVEASAIEDPPFFLGMEIVRLQWAHMHLSSQPSSHELSSHPDVLPSGCPPIQPRSHQAIQPASQPDDPCLRMVASKSSRSCSNLRKYVANLVNLCESSQ